MVEDPDVRAQIRIFSASLDGQIEIGGLSWDDYTQKNIFDPLSMKA